MKALQRFLCTALTIGCSIQTLSFAQTIEHSSNGHTWVHIDKTQNAQRYLTLPIEESAPEATMRILVNGVCKQTLQVHLATNQTDYVCPLDLGAYQDQQVVLDIVQRDLGRGVSSSNSKCWNEIKLCQEFDASNRETLWRPAYHFTPAYGWMNDPNGMFYLDGVWHLYYQHNPYGSMWGNMSWGHATSTDLMHWQHQPLALEGDGIGAIFSGSCVVDKDNTAGFGHNAVIAIYTAGGDGYQSQCLAYSTDGGFTFQRYAGNPILTGEILDFRDPNMFWNEQTQAWNLSLACGQEMRFYSSPNLKDWKYESSFGIGQGAHGGVWECPDLFKLKVQGSKEEKWVLLCNLNPGGPYGGSATQYFVGEWDGHTFTNEAQPYARKWMDWGKDHYATVSWSNAPQNRRVAIAWMSNWEYAGIVPTKQYRAANSLPRELSLKYVNHEYVLCSEPVKEVELIRGESQKIAKTSISQTADVKLGQILEGKTGSYELDLDFQSGKAKRMQVTLANSHNEKLVLCIDTEKGQCSLSRPGWGGNGQHAAVTAAPIGKHSSYHLRVFVDNSSIEIFDTDNNMVMSNVMFPQSAMTELYASSPLKGSFNLSVKANALQ